jgi:hypothetical protein
MNRNLNSDLGFWPLIPARPLRRPETRFRRMFLRGLIGVPIKRAQIHEYDAFFDALKEELFLFTCARPPNPPYIILTYRELLSVINILKTLGTVARRLILTRVVSSQAPRTKSSSHSIDANMF